MQSQIDSSVEILQRYLKDPSQAIDRKEVVAHATLSALSHHWPSKSTAQIHYLLEVTQKIKTLEHSRWAIQRRIAIAKFHRYFEASSLLEESNSICLF